MLVTTIGQYMINLLAVKFARYKHARTIGIYFSEVDAKQRLWSAYLKLFLESYFDICFCAFLNTIAFKDAIKQSLLHEHFSTLSNIWVSLTTVFYDLALIIFPLYAYFLIRDNFATLSTDNTMNKFGIFYEGMSLRTKMSSMYNVIFMLRRLLTAIVLVFMTELPFFQTQLLLVMSTMNVIYMVSVKPIADNT